ncbi:hypothetical protein ATO49_05845 [Mycolicibacterium fortuitum subsp. fortuitum DSM 46621 = ATCC 6841 = JCM 6387]|nr:hypothetical protein ATO49_05845 [Mycolicibacterium fortuitum subsp. fortuitum DSM 46621 = ATCC 6841 = JCM 6387]
MECLVRGSDRAGAPDQPLCGGQPDARLGDDHLGLTLGRQVPHRQRDETLPEGRFELFERAAVGGVIGAHQHESLWRMDDFTGAIQIERAPVVGE